MLFGFGSLLSLFAAVLSCIIQLNPERFALNKEATLKNAISLRGTSKTGKSQTIRTFVELLTAKYPDSTSQHEHRTKTDIRVVLSVNRLKIGVESRGDRLIESLDLFVKSGCDVIVCATRTKGRTNDAVSALQSQEYDVHPLEQPTRTQPHEQVLRSLVMAREIVEQVTALISAAETPVRSLSATA